MPFRRETKAQLDRRKLRGYHDQQREPLRAVGHLRVDDADRFDSEQSIKVEFERPRVFAFLRIQHQEAAALETAGVKR